MKPNLFDYATNELSHDAFFAWLLRWADPLTKSYNEQLHLLGRELLELLVDEKYSIVGKKLIAYDVGRQWENTDIYAEFTLEDGRSILLIIEDKTFSGEHDNQLERYKQIGLDYCELNKMELSCTFLKIGSEPLKTLERIKSIGYKIVTREDLLALFKKSPSCEHPLIEDFHNHLVSLNNAYLAYNNTLINNLKGLIWVGLYQYIETHIPVNIWHYVNNPSGGFWNLCLTWKYWNCFPVYMQIEEDVLTFKIALSEDETGLSNKDINVNAVQDFVHYKLMEFSKLYKLTDIEAPHPFVHRGSYRTIGKIKRHHWLGGNDEYVNGEKVISYLKELNQHYEKFIESLQNFEYKQFCYVKQLS